MAAISARSVLIVFGITTGALVAASSVSSSTGGRAENSRQPISSQLRPHPADHRVPTKDGALNPELFSDESAVSMFLLMAAHPDARAGLNYVRHVFNKGNEGKYQALTPEAVEGIRLAAVEYDTKLKALYRSGVEDFRQSWFAYACLSIENSRTPGTRRRRASGNDSQSTGEASHANVLRHSNQQRIRKSIMTKTIARAVLFACVMTVLPHSPLIAVAYAYECSGLTDYVAFGMTLMRTTTSSASTPVASLSQI